MSRAQVTRPGRAGASPGAQDAGIVCTVFGIGVTEMIVIGLVILMLFSPRELPGMMKTLARAYGSIRRTAEEFRSQVMDAEELREPIEEIRAAYHGTKTELLSAQDLARRELGRARAEAMKAQQRLSELAREESRRESTILKGRVSANESPDEPAHKTAAIGPGAPAGAVASVPSVASPTGVNASSAPTGATSPAAVNASSAPAVATPPAGVNASSAPAIAIGAPTVAASSAPTIATANTVPSPPAVPTPAPPPPVVASPSFAPPPSASPSRDRSDAA